MITARMPQSQAVSLEYRRSVLQGGAPWIPAALGWRSPANSWLLAHDMYHHLPQDSGTVAEELATLGAEYYVCHEPLDSGKDDSLSGLQALQQSAAGIVGSAFESDRNGAVDFCLWHAATARVSDAAWGIFTAVAMSAVVQLAEMLEGNDDPEWMAALHSFSMDGVVASWLISGYAAAQIRFPDQRHVRKSWQEALHQLQELESSTQDGTRLTATLGQGSDRLQLEVASPSP